MTFDEQFIIDDGHITVAGKTKKTIVNSYDIYMGNDVDLEQQYHQLCHLLRVVVNKDDDVTFHLGNFGGSCHAGMQIVNAVQNCKGKVTMQVEFPCYSMGALLAISGNDLVMEPSTFLMFHNYSGGSRGKGAELIKGALETHKWLMGMFERIGSPFLTNKEIKKLMRDEDIYIHHDDKTLETRKKRHFK